MYNEGIGEGYVPKSKSNTISFSMPEVNITAIIKYAITILLTGGIATGGHLWDRGNMQTENQHALGIVIQMMSKQLNDCNHRLGSRSHASNMMDDSQLFIK